MAKGFQKDPVLRAVFASLRPVAAAGEKVLVAVSGGADSLALALAIAEIAPRLDFEVAVGTVDHGLRASSAAEVERVRRWSGARGIEFAAERVKVGKEGGLEAAARQARYAALERLADRLGARWIATAHTASDQAETVLLRLGRGAGVRGARGVLPVRGRIVRPLLAVTRAEVEAFLESRGERALVEDPSNRDLSRARNQIRHRVLPELQKALGPGADRALARFASLARDDEAALDAWARRTKSDRRSLRKLPVAVLRRWVRQHCEALGYRPNAAELQSAARLIRGEKAGEVELGRRVAVRAAGSVGIGLVSKPSAAGPTELTPGSPIDLAWAAVSVQLARDRRSARGLLELSLPADIALPLVVRPVQPGDRLAGERGTVRVKRLLVDRKVPRHTRPSIPVVLDAEGNLLWVVGLRVSADLRAARAKPGWRLTVRPL